jgi:AcrR family transcriptional regulator
LATPDPPRQRRSDARRNRARILEVAHDEFAADGAVSLNVIAARAGVGAGTLYRHFPTREALILAVYQHDVQELADSVQDVLADLPPLDAFRAWFERLADYVRVKHGLGEALHTAAAQQIVNETYAPVTAAIERLLEACADAGDVRPGLDAGDVLLLMGFMWRVPAGRDGQAQGLRVMELAIVGLAVDARLRLDYNVNSAEERDERTGGAAASSTTAPPLPVSPPGR